MQPDLEKRLAELKQQYEDGQKMLADLEAKVASLRSTLVRINGAIQALEEQIAAEGKTAGSGRPDTHLLP